MEGETLDREMNSSEMHPAFPTNGIMSHIELPLARNGVKRLATENRYDNSRNNGGNNSCNNTSMMLFSR